MLGAFDEGFRLQQQAKHCTSEISAVTPALLTADITSHEQYDTTQQFT
jgi:hypothetical protein